MSKKKNEKNYKGKRVSVVGLGRSGRACVKLLLSLGAEVFVSDLSWKDISDLPGIEAEFGKHSDRILDADEIILSPGVPLSEPIVSEAYERGIPVMGELEFGSQFIDNPIIGVTGTNGKTTTAYLIHNVLQAAGKNAVVCGNMGIPLASLVQDLSKDKLPIVEVSSFQLETIDSFHPHIGILLNIAQDHLDRYKSFDEYRKTKLRLFSNQTEDDSAVLNLDDPGLANLSLRAQTFFFSTEKPAYIWVNNGDILWIEEKLCSRRDLHLKCQCLIEDYLAAIAVAKLLDISTDDILLGFRAFKGIPHRLEDVATIRGIRFINNSMCTNPVSFVKTLSSFEEPVILIAGGKRKGMNINPIVNALKKQTKYTILIGEVSSEIAKSLKDNYAIAQSMKEAVKLAFFKASTGDIVLLSPGFASFDWFKDFEDRGNQFKQAVKKLQ